ncbi:MAG: glycosyltransferase family 9 protein [Candidatus Omnitrophica bacterium]|nr:glycosyltransferase family 9 protein [Candidatus Omnitrophota bacterium]
MKKYVFRSRTKAFLARMLDAVGFLSISVPNRLRGQTPVTPRNLLVIRIDHLGDILQTTAVPRLLKARFPESRVIFLTSSWGASLLENNPFVDDRVIYDAPWFSKKRYVRSSESLGIFELAGALKRRKIDLCLCLRGDLRENMIAWLAGIPQRVGYGITGGGFFLTQELTYRDKVHESRHTRDVLDAIGVPCDDLKPELYFSENETRSLSSKCSALGLPVSQKIVGFHVEAGSTAKQWPSENMRIFLRQLKARYPEGRVLLVGSDPKKTVELQVAQDPYFINSVGRTTLRELCQLIKQCRLFIGPDSGPTHIAAALGVRTLFLYSGTNVYEQWRPLAENAVVLRYAVPCSPCGLEDCHVPGHPCMSRITPEQVLEAVEKL